MLNFQKTRFLTSAAAVKQAPKDEGKELAFVGRSNSGKSSALNAITRIGGLARTSKTPGRTQLINFFTIDDAHRLVDLPGYGFAKVHAEIKERWQKELMKYLDTRESLVGIILIMDSRHPFQPYDIFFLEWAAQAQLPMHILLSKSDKLSRQQLTNTLRLVKNELINYGENFSVQSFSALKKHGVDEARKVVSQWLM